MKKFEKSIIKAFKKWHKQEIHEQGREFTYYQALDKLAFVKDIGLWADSKKVVAFADKKIRNLSMEEAAHYALDDEEAMFVETFRRLLVQYGAVRNSEYPLQAELEGMLEASALEKGGRLHKNAVRYLKSAKAKYHSWIWGRIQMVGYDESEEPYRRSQQTEYYKYKGLTADMTLDELMDKSAVKFKLVFTEYLKKKEQEAKAGT